MPRTEILADYLWKNHRQALFEEMAEGGYRVTVVNRYSSYSKAAETFLESLPEGKKAEYKARLDAAAPTKEEEPRKGWGRWQQERKNAKSKQQTA